MFRQVRYSNSGIPIPLDSMGNEMCLLFLKYGRCRYRKKCKKSHWRPPLPDEEFPMPPPLPLSPPPWGAPPLPSDGNLVSVVTSACPDIHSQQSNKAHSATEKNSDSFYMRNDSGLLSNRGQITSSLQEVREIIQTDDSGVISLSQFTCGTKNHKDNRILIGNISTTHTTQVLNTGCSVTSTETGITVVKSTGLCSTLEDKNLTVSGIEEAVDDVIQKICRERSRFDHVYIQDRTDQETTWRYKSSTEQTYKHYGAYYNNSAKRLEVVNKPRNKTEKRNLKLMRRAHWNTWQVLNSRLAQLPPGYSLKVNFIQVNFTRLRPYFSLLVHQCFHTGLACPGWRPTRFSCLVADTIIAFLRSGNSTPMDIEKKLREWGGRPVRVRQCVSHMWSIIVKSSLSTTGVAQDVLTCEKEVLAKKLCSVDYAYACYLARPLTRGNMELSYVKPLAVSKSVRQGIQASKRMLHKRGTTIFKSLETARSTGITISTNSMESRHCRTSNNKGLLVKKHRSNRSKQLSLLDEQGKENLLKRCETILKN